MIETGQIILLVMAIIAFGALAAAPSWWTAILLVGVLEDPHLNQVLGMSQNSRFMLGPNSKRRCSRSRTTFPS